MGDHPASAPAASLIVPPHPASVVPAQQFVRTVLANSDIDDDVADLAVSLTESLVNNGILHAQSHIVLTVKISPECIRIEVDDEHAQPSSGVVQLSRDGLSEH
jgi:hypothetical protein